MALEVWAETCQQANMDIDGDEDIINLVCVIDRELRDLTNTLLDYSLCLASQR